METVLLKQLRTYDPDALEPVIDRIFRTFGVYDDLRPGMTAVLKPNLILRSDPAAAAVTHPLFVQAVGRCVQKTGARVLIAESPGGPYAPGVMRGHFKGCGYTQMAEANGFLLYTDCQSREVALPQGRRCRQAPIVEPFLGADYLIDLPKVKTHSMVGYSGAVKNLFGCVPGLQKPELHCRFPERGDFSEMLVDLAEFLAPQFTVMDGIWAMEGDGPTGGDRRELGLVAAGRNPFAADVAVAALLGMVPENVDMLRIGAQRGLGPRTLGEVELLGDDFAALAAPDFRKAKVSSTDFVDRLPRALRPMAKKWVTPRPKIDRKRCVGCGKCAESCPQHTITLVDRKAQIDSSRCIRCFCCQEMCPQHCIQVKRLSLLKL